MTTAIEARSEPAGTTAALVPADHHPSTALVMPAAPTVDIERAFHAYQELCERLLVPSDFQRIGNKDFRKRSGWRKLAVAYGVSVELRAKDYERDDRNRIVRAEVEARAIAPNGRYMDGLGACDITERCCDPATCTNTNRKHQHCAPDCNGFGHFSKPGHDLPATAHTRAVSRACSDLFGLGEVSAEEVSEHDVAHHEQPPEQPPDLGPVPEGFASHDESLEAHKAINRAIKELPDDIDREPFRAYRVEHGWPMSKAELHDLHLLILRAAGEHGAGEAMSDSSGDEQAKRRARAHQVAAEAGIKTPDDDPGRPFEPETAPERPADADLRAAETSGGGSPPQTSDERMCASCAVAPATTAIDGVELCDACEAAELAAPK